jgi:hypothetical protein
MPNPAASLLYRLARSTKLSFRAASYRLAHRQLLRHCCKAGLVFELQPGVSRVQFPTTPTAPTGNLWNLDMHVLVYLCLKSSHFCYSYSAPSFFPTFCSVSFLVSVSQPPPVLLVTTSNYGLSKLITARCRHVSRDRIKLIMQSWLSREGGCKRGAEVLISGLSLQGVPKFHRV